MRKATVLLALSVCLLTPVSARADDGGFWDWLFRWNTKFMGIGTDFHLLCVDASGQRVEGCERLFGLLSRPASFRLVNVKHEVNLRVEYLFSYGKTIPPEDLPPNVSGPRVHGAKIMGMYYYRVNKFLDVGGGGGTLPVFGNDILPTWRGIVAGSVVIAPYKALYIRPELSYLTGTIDGARWGFPTSPFLIEPEWNFSIAVGYDRRRLQ